VPSVGILYNGSVEPESLAGSARPDHVVVIPERFWEDGGRQASPQARYRHPPGPRGVLDRLARTFPVAAHGLGLSIASACFFDRAHVRELARLDRQFGFAWVSEHLSAFRVDDGGRVDHHAGVPIPMPWGPELLDLVADRVDEVQQILGRPLALENGVELTPIEDAEMSEPELWCALHRRTGVRMLLDLHNLHVNERNLGLDPIAWMDALPAGAVEEVHVAGGNWIGGTYFDSHSGRSPARVHELLRHALRSFGGLRAITFEFHESYFGEIGRQGVEDELRALRAIVDEAADSATPRQVARVAG
jgi:uncharacterized protein (UPF0276 family)